MTTSPPAATADGTPGGIVRTWLPLAASWTLMGVEGPAVAAVMARLRDPEASLAAFGGIVFPVALLLEAPIIMMLAASTALCGDLEAFRALRRRMTLLAAALTAIYAVVAFTPLFDVVARLLVGDAPELLEPGRLGLQLMLPWIWTIADRRFHQGVLIRFGRASRVGLGTLVRLAALGAVLVGGASIEGLGGMAVGAAAISAGVTSEMIYTRLAVRSVVRGPLRAAPIGPDPRAARFWSFYVPLALTPLLGLIAHPLGAAGIARMPEALASLAAWPALRGFVFLVRSPGMAFNEVAIRHAGDADGPRRLGAFAVIAGSALSLLLAACAWTPLGRVWFGDVCGLEPALAALASSAIAWSVPVPLLGFLHSYWQGLLVHEGRTRAITEATAIYLVVVGAGLVLGATLDRMPGASAASAALAAGAVVQAIWLWRRSRR